MARKIFNYIVNKVTFIFGSPKLNKVPSKQEILNNACRKVGSNG